MSIYTVNEPQGFATQFGQQLGKSLAEQLPKEVERGRLSGALKGLEGSNLTPMQQYAALSRYADPQTLATLVPMLQAAQARAAYAGNGAQPTPTGQAKQAPESQPSVQEFTTPQSLGRKLMAANPAQYPTPESAQKDAEIRIDTANKELDRIKETFLNKTGNETYKDIVGELDEQYRNRLLNSIDYEGNEKAEANKIGNEMLNFAKVRGDLRTNLAKTYLNMPHDKMMRSLDKIRKDYENNGQIGNFANDLIAGGMSGNYARAFTQPLENDLNLKKYMFSIPQKKGDFSFDPRKGPLGFKERKNDVPKKISEEILNKISPNVSLSSIGLELFAKGYNPESFMQYANEHQDKLSKLQLEELGKTDRWYPNLDDMFILGGEKGPSAWFKRIANMFKG